MDGGAGRCREASDRAARSCRRCCEVNGPQSASERVDVEERRQVERSEVMDVLEGENKTL